MLKVDQYDYIRTAHRVFMERRSNRSQETGHSKTTIKKVLRDEYRGYKPRMRQPYLVLGPYLKVIDKWLEDDKERPKIQRTMQRLNLIEYLTKDGVFYSIPN